MAEVVVDKKMDLEKVVVQAAAEPIQEVAYLAKATRADQWSMLCHMDMLVVVAQAAQAATLVITELTEAQVLAELDWHMP
jgi:hypothetical protein